MLVNLQVTVEATGNTEYIPCYVLSSSKPLWKGEVNDCGLILGTNALVSLRFMVYHVNGATIQPERIENRENNNSEVLRITFEQRLCLRSYQTKTVKVRLGEDEEHYTSQTVPRGILTPCEFILAREGRDFLEELWDGSHGTKVSVTNWEGYPIQLDKGMTVGESEKVALVKRSDSWWEETVNPLVRVCHLSDDLLDDRQEKLQGRLSVGESVEGEARELFMRLLLSEHQAFALSEQELEETDVVEHVIDTGNAKPLN